MDFFICTLRIFQACVLVGGNVNVLTRLIQRTVNKAHLREDEPLTVRKIRSWNRQAFTSAWITHDMTKMTSKVVTKAAATV